MEEFKEAVRVRVEASTSELGDAARAQFERLAEPLLTGVRSSLEEQVYPAAAAAASLLDVGRAHAAALEESALARVRGASPRPCLRPARAAHAPAEGVFLALDHPNSALGLGTAALLVAVRFPSAPRTPHPAQLPPTRRALWSGTFGRLRSDASRLASAERRLAGQAEALASQEQEARKLAERAALASEEYGRGRAKLVAAGGQLRSLAASARRQEARSAGLLDDVQRLKLAAPLLRDASAAAHEATKARREVERSLRKVAHLVPV